MVIIFHNPTHELLGRREGKDFSPLAQKDWGLSQVGAQGVDRAGINSNFDRVNTCGGPCGSVIRISSFFCALRLSSNSLRLSSAACFAVEILDAAAVTVSSSN